MFSPWSNFCYCCTADQNVRPGFVHNPSSLNTCHSNYLHGLKWKIKLLITTKPVGMDGYWNKSLYLFICKAKFAFFYAKNIYSWLDFKIDEHPKCYWTQCVMLVKCRSCAKCNVWFSSNYMSAFRVTWNFYMVALEFAFPLYTSQYDEVSPRLWTVTDM